MNPAIQFLLLSCKKASALIDKKSEIDLSWTESIQLRLHTSLCDSCTAYMKQSAVIEKVLHDHFQNIASQSETIIENQSLKERIISRL